MSVYAPPGKTLTHENLVALTTCAPTFLALGDLNAKHPTCNCAGTTQNGSLLYNHQYPEIGNNNPDIRDITLYKNINFIYELEVLQELNSIHLPVLAILENTTTEATKEKQPRLNAIITRNIDIEKNIPSPAEVQEYTETLTKTIQNTINTVIPLTKIKKHQITLPTSITDLIHARNRAKRAWQCNRTQNLKME
ncbi:hypothetical protein PR048_007476 [Dryococelus australis]|uniref:Endonuclease/exonuclease/phosphatase domain-containing protein n=1 Tax=Dryococelus australis TaxID=614101 RepID=A0ABQ9HV89_9NEOP|nr:hypothetical protein PR048_007476 [Dryococelus australis]